MCVFFSGCFFWISWWNLNPRVLLLKWAAPLCWHSQHLLAPAGCVIKVFLATRLGRKPTPLLTLLSNFTRQGPWKRQKEPTIHWFLLNLKLAIFKWAMKKPWLFRVCRGLYYPVGLLISYYKYIISKMECHNGFEHCPIDLVRASQCWDMPTWWSHDDL